MLKNAKIKRRLTHQLVYQKLKSSILNGDIDPGKKLNQDELSVQFGVSRMPIRDALRLLEAENLVHNDPNSGFVVTCFDAEDLKDIFFLRSILEPEAVLLAKDFLTEKDIEKLEKVLVKIDSYIPKKIFGKISRLNTKFHFLIYNLIPSKLLKSTIASLWDKFPRYACTESESLQVYRDQHYRILNALKINNFISAAEMMKEHILSNNNWNIPCIH